MATSRRMRQPRCLGGGGKGPNWSSWWHGITSPERQLLVHWHLLEHTWLMLFRPLLYLFLHPLSYRKIMNGERKSSEKIRTTKDALWEFRCVLLVHLLRRFVFAAFYGASFYTFRVEVEIRWNKWNKQDNSVISIMQSFREVSKTIISKENV